ncbi:MAG: pyruvate:ferredoxin (flavodoxin) oxidoreductase [Treponema sp.]|nr:pyruvate:ferredoxin (flavodoxin) oxidoreductase [Treponema sp.]
MAEKNYVTIEGNTAAAWIAHALSEVIAIYPITPSSQMGELSDEFSAQGRKNIWGAVPEVVELQSEAGAAAAVHGALTTGAMSTTFTASQGLLLMIPSMYKIAGELTSTVFHISARALATSSLCIFGDHQDVMACRQTGWAMLSSNSVQEVMDLALISHAATLRSRVPFLHFFDGFRTSHEMQKVEETSYELMRQMIDDDLVAEHRRRGLSPEHPQIRGTSQNPDTYFQGREGVNKYYEACAAIVQAEMDKYAKLTGRAYRIFDYYGAKDAEKVVIIMGSGADTVEETIDYLNAKGEKTGMIKVRLYRPFDAKAFVKALPPTVKAIAVLDRTKDPGANGEPLYQDVRTAIAEMQFAGEFSANPLIVGGRYGLGSKEFTPAMVKAVFENLSGKKIAGFAVGLKDDVLGKSLDYDPEFFLPEEGMYEALFYGLGADGTVGANKNSIKIISEAKPEYNVQAYFSYDSKKSGGFTVSHLRFNKTGNKIRRPYLINSADFLACHKFSYMEMYNMLPRIKEGGTFLLNSPYKAANVWKELPVEVQEKIIKKKLKFYVIDGAEIARKTGMGNRINTVMQAAYFKISGILQEAEAVKLMKEHIEHSYGKKGSDVVQKNYATVDAALGAVEEVKYPASADGSLRMKKPFATAKDDQRSDAAWIRETLGAVSFQFGETLPVSKIPADGTFPTATSQYEKRSVAERVPLWNPSDCIQCGNCSVVCPHACIRMKNLTDDQVAKAPKGFLSAEIMPKAKAVDGMKATLCIAYEDCYECGLCLTVCPQTKEDGSKKALSYVPYSNDPEFHAEQVKVWDYFLSLPETPADGDLSNPKALAYKRPLFEFSGACGGCGETPYIKLMSQLFGDRALIGNATGCSSIYGGNLPTTPYAQNAQGRGPVWSNSLFEDTAEFAYGFRLTSDKLAEHARQMAVKAKGEGIAVAILDKILANSQADEASIDAMRATVDELRAALKNDSKPTAKMLLSVADHFVKRSVWGFGGDGWAYDIGFGGLDHVIASDKNVNLLCMDTEVYSNTGGQMSKSTPIGAIAKFAYSGRGIGKKDLGAIAMSYGHVYVAQISLGANMAQTIKAFREAESYDGPSLIIAYSHCIAHGIDMSRGLDQGKAIVSCGLWPLYRYDPRLKAQGKNPFQLDSKDPTTSVEDFMYKENRFNSLKAADQTRADMLLGIAKANAERKWKELKYLAERPF